MCSGHADRLRRPGKIATSCNCMWRVCGCCDSCCAEHCAALHTCLVHMVLALIRFGRANPSKKRLRLSAPGAAMAGLKLSRLSVAFLLYIGLPPLVTCA